MLTISMSSSREGISNSGQAPHPFHYQDRGTMVTVGRNAAAAYSGGSSSTGFSAWVIWLGAHILNLIGFRTVSSCFSTGHGIVCSTSASCVSFCRWKGYQPGNRKCYRR